MSYKYLYVRPSEKGVRKTDIFVSYTVDRDDELDKALFERDLEFGLRFWLIEWTRITSGVLDFINFEDVTTSSKKWQEIRHS